MQGVGSALSHACMPLIAYMSELANPLWSAIRAQVPLFVAVSTPLLLTLLVICAHYSAAAILVAFVMPTFAVVCFLVAPVGAYARAAPMRASSPLALSP